MYARVSLSMIETISAMPMPALPVVAAMPPEMFTTFIGAVAETSALELPGIGPAALISTLSPIQARVRSSKTSTITGARDRVVTVARRAGCGDRRKRVSMFSSLSASATIGTPVDRWSARPDAAVTRDGTSRGRVSARADGRVGVDEQDVYDDRPRPPRHRAGRAGDREVLQASGAEACAPRTPVEVIVLPAPIVAATSKLT